MPPSPQRPMPSPGFYSRSGTSWTRLPEEMYAPPSISDVRPAPPRPPRLAALMSRSGLLSSDTDDGGELRHFSCWRLRWCAFCLLVATAIQASNVGAALQLLYADEDHSRGAGPQLLGASILLAMLLVALWSLLSVHAQSQTQRVALVCPACASAALLLIALLASPAGRSQLLLWSDAAVMKVPEGVRVREAKGNDLV